MIDIQPHLDKLDRLKEYMDAHIELKVWMKMPLKPFPYNRLSQIEKYHTKEHLEYWNRKYKTLPEYLQLNN
jgi:hypothetical protein